MGLLGTPWAYVADIKTVFVGLLGQAGGIEEFLSSNLLKIVIWPSSPQVLRIQRPRLGAGILYLLILIEQSISCLMSSN